MRPLRRYLFALTALLGLLAAPVAEGQFRSRDFVTISDQADGSPIVDNISWYQAETVTWDIFSQWQGDPDVIPGAGEPRWKAWLTNDVTTLYIDVTGTVETASSGHIQVSLLPSESNFAVGTYESEVAVWVGSTNMGVVARNQIEVLYSPASTTVTYVGTVPTTLHVLKAGDSMSGVLTNTSGFHGTATNSTGADGITISLASPPTDGHLLQYDATGNVITNAAAGAADNLGNHTATQSLNLDGESLTNGFWLVATNLNVVGGTIQTNGVNLDFAGGSGDVTGPGSSLDNAIARFDGTGGKTLQNSTDAYVNDGGDVLARGIFSNTNGTPRAELNSDGTVESVSTNPQLVFTDTDHEDYRIKADANELYVYNASDDATNLTISGAGVVTFALDPLVPDEAYGAGFNGSLEPPTKNSIFDAFGATPGGELGGTWASPTVDSTHAGSAHHAQAHADADHNNDALDPDKITGDLGDNDLLDHEIGGLELDVSAYDGVVAIAGGATAEVNSKAELETQIDDVADFAEADGDTYTGVHDMGGATSLEIPHGATPTVDTFGEVAGDNNAFAASKGAVIVYDGTISNFLVGVSATDTPTDGQVPKIAMPSGVITWEDDNQAAPASGDAIEVEDGDNGGSFSAVDTTARLEDSADINFERVDGGAGGPDEVTGTLRDNVVAAAEMADADHGDVSWSSGIATVDSGAVLLDEVGDPGGAKTFTHADTETVKFSTGSDGEVFITIDLTDADLAADTVGFLITAVDNDDANYIPLRIQDDSAGGPDTLLELDYQGVLTLGSAGALNPGLTMGAAAITEAELEILDGATITTAELDTLSDGSNADSLHVHASAGISGIVNADLSGSAGITAANLDLSMSPTWTGNHVFDEAIESPIALSNTVSGTITFAAGDMNRMYFVTTSGLTGTLPVASGLTAGDWFGVQTEAVDLTVDINANSANRLKIKGNSGLLTDAITSGASTNASIVWTYPGSGTNWYCISKDDGGGSGWQ